MKRSKTLINELKQSISDKKDSELFAQNLYESSNFNTHAETDYILGEFHVKSSYSNLEYNVKGSVFERENFNNTSELGIKNAKEFRKKKLKL